MVCTARAARCEICPVQSGCRWRGVGPDPAKSPTATRQPRFDGSDRQGRGRLLRAVALYPVRDADLASTMGWPSDPERAQRVATTVLVDGLVERFDGRWTLIGERHGPVSTADAGTYHPATSTTTSASANDVTQIAPRTPTCTTARFGTVSPLA
jgi:hypothetical protein